jgi:hypothetical protein
VLSFDDMEAARSAQAQARRRRGAGDLLTDESSRVAQSSRLAPLPHVAAAAPAPSFGKPAPSPRSTGTPGQQAVLKQQEHLDRQLLATLTSLSSARAQKPAPPWSTYHKMGASSQTPRGATSRQSPRAKERTPFVPGGRARLWGDTPESAMATTIEGLNSMPATPRPRGAGAADAATTESRARDASGREAVRQSTAAVSGLLSEWRSSFEVELDGFASTAICIELKLRHALRATFGVRSPNRLRTAVVCDCLDCLGVVLGRYRPLLAILVSELLTAVFADFAPGMRGHGVEAYLQAQSIA